MSLAIDSESCLTLSSSFCAQPSEVAMLFDSIVLFESTKLPLKTDALAARVGEVMDLKGLDVCNSLERDKACWRGVVAA